MILYWIRLMTRSSGWLSYVDPPEYVFDTEQASKLSKLQSSISQWSTTYQSATT